MKIDLTKYDPPGMDTGKEQGFFITGMVLSLFYSIPYLDAYWDEYQSCFDRVGDTRVVDPRITIEPFFEILDKYLMGYFILAACMFVAVAIRYAYYRQGSKSIYLMRRLPDERFLHYTCWLQPMVRAGLSLLAALVSLAVFYGIYVFVTPAACLPWN